MTNYVVFLFLVGTMVYGIEKTIGKQESKRSDILVHDVVQKMVAEQIERKKILKKFRKIENELGDVKRELKERNTLMKDTKFLQKMLLLEVKHMKEEVKQTAEVEIKKKLSRFKQRILGRMKNLWIKIKLHVKPIKGQIGDLKREFGEMRKKFSKEYGSINNDIADLRNKTSESRKEVAFFATLLGHTTTSSAIVFNNVITNIGGGYNIRDGTFHCPTPGLYLFSSTLTASGSAYVVGHLMKNQKQVARFHENINVRYYPSASLTAVLRLTTGDKVWIKGYGIRYYSPDNAFTGVLIKQT